MTKLFEAMLAQNIEAGKTKKEIYTKVAAKGMEICVGFHTP